MIDPEREKESRELLHEADRAAFGASHRDPNTVRAAIDNCVLCDDDGYRGGTVCDHVDHTLAAKRGMALIREAMGWPEP